MVTKCQKCNKDIMDYVGGDERSTRSNGLCFDCFVETHSCKCGRFTMNIICDNCKVREIGTPITSSYVVSGTRKYSTMRHNNEIFLVGLFGINWYSKEMHFKCFALRSPRDDATTKLFNCIDQGHTCGIYMNKPKIDEYECGIYADCIAWGEIQEHTRGYKCSDVRIELLRLQLSNTATSMDYKNYKLLARELAEKYKVPVQVSGPRAIIYYIDGSQPPFLFEEDGTRVKIQFKPQL